MKQKEALKNSLGYSANFASNLLDYSTIMPDYASSSAAESGTFDEVCDRHEVLITEAKAIGERRGIGQPRTRANNREV